MPDISPTLQQLVKRIQKQLRTGNDVAAQSTKAILEVRQKIFKLFKSGNDVEKLILCYCEVMDSVLIALWHHFKPSKNMSLGAVGGYGRKELLPQSDIDLLLLIKDEPSEQDKHFIESFLSSLWDLGLDIGHSVRTPFECGIEAKKDITIATNLLEARLLVGNQCLYSSMLEATTADVVFPGDLFYKEKLEERENRHNKYDRTAYKLEPNVKESPGGLRELHLIGWLSKRYFKSSKLHDLYDLGYLYKEEFQALSAARVRLLEIRFALHFIVNRHEDRLLFENQKLLAEFFGYKDQKDGTLAVEQFMQSYYRTVQQVERLNEIFLQFSKEIILHENSQLAIRDLDENFSAHGHDLTVKSDDVFVHDQAAIFYLFLLLQKNPDITGVSAHTIRLLRQAIAQIDENFRTDKRANQVFVQILSQPHGVTEQLKHMNRYGLLAAFIIPWGHIVGRMQYDLFHIYTVDQHTLFVIRNVRRFRLQRYKKQFSLAAQCFATINQPELLYLAALFHDIAKGRGGDHSELGAEDAVVFCQRLGLNQSDSKLVSWLVRNHLTMSVTAQRQDITDPEVIQNFATIVGDSRRLNFLYLLTVADIWGTNKTLWNSWRDSLISELYKQTRKALKRGLTNPIDQDERIFVSRSDAWNQLESKKYDSDRVAEVWKRFPDDIFLRLQANQIAWITEGLISNNQRHNKAIVLSRYREKRGATEVFVYNQNVDGLFHTLSTCLGKLRLNVLDARLFNTKDGFAMDLFHLSDSDGNPANISRLNKISSYIELILTKQTPVKISKQRLTRGQKQFSASALISFTEQKARGKTLLELVLSDHPGLLIKISKAFVKAGVRVHDAKIATFGNQVEDYFVLSDEDDRPLSKEMQAMLSSYLKQALDVSSIK